MANFSNHWRNKQIGKNFLTQELKCLEFINKHNNLTWHWKGLDGNFCDYCKQNFCFDNNNYNGLVFVNYLTFETPGTVISNINKLLHDNIKAVYLAINRFEFRAVNDLQINYAVDISDCIDQIVSHCGKSFTRLYHAPCVDNKHFVGVHGLDVFVYERN